MQHRKFKTIVRGVSNGNFKDIDRDIYYPDSSSSTGIGMFINKDAYRKYLKGSYGQELLILSNNIDDPRVKDDIIAFDIGKTALLMILAQEKCEGIRLISVKNALGKPTLLAMGISANQVSSGDHVLATPVRSDPGDKDSIMSEEVHGSSLRNIFQFFEKKLNESEDVLVDQMMKLL